MANVSLHQIKKVYPGNVEAIKSASFEIEDGEFVVLVGPSGCGKSTLLRMIAGLETISEGEMSINDQRVNELSPKDRDIAMVFQNYALYPHMTVFDNMAFGLKLRKYPKTEIRERVEDAASVLGLEAYLDRRPKAMSGGQRQRVAIGRAIVRKPKVFLFDEPLSNLDAKLRVQMRVEIKKLHAQLGATMIYVTHDQVEAMTMGDKIVVLKDGYVQQVAAPMELYNNPANKFVGSFIGSPSMNFFNGKILNNDQLQFKGNGLSFLIDSTQADNLRKTQATAVILGVRPEHIFLAAEATNPTATQKVEVLVTEPVGAETYIYFTLKEETYCMRANGQKYFEVGEEIEIAFDQSKLFFFNQADELRIA